MPSVNFRPFCSSPNLFKYLLIRLPTHTGFAIICLYYFLINRTQPGGYHVCHTVAMSHIHVSNTFLITYWGNELFRSIIIIHLFTAKCPISGFKNSSFLTYFQKKIKNNENLIHLLPHNMLFKLLSINIALWFNMLYHLTVLRTNAAQICNVHRKLTQANLVSILSSIVHRAGIPPSKLLLVVVVKTTTMTMMLYSLLLLLRRWRWCCIVCCCCCCCCCCCWWWWWCCCCWWWYWCWWVMMTRQNWGIWQLRPARV